MHTTKFLSGPHQGHLIGDSGYPLRTYLMTPYPNPATPPQSRYNHALEQTRVKIENTFAILKNRWGGLHGGLRCSPSRASKIITACAMLHNIALEANDRGEDFDAVNQDRLPQVQHVNRDDLAAGRARRDFIANTYFA